MNISILSIGDEILIGQIINSNAAWMAKQCTDIGGVVLRHYAIADIQQEICSALKELLKVSDTVLMTGGLGATHDDVTKFALIDYFDDKLILHQPTIERLTEMFRFRGKPLTKSNANQALIPSRCTALDNDRGAAPGICFREGAKTVVAMPGVPREMQGIMERHVLPMLQKEIMESGTNGALYKTLHTAGIPESDLAEAIGDVAELPNGCTLAFLPAFSGVRLRIGAKGSTPEDSQKLLELVESAIRLKVGKYIYGVNGATLEQTVGKMLTEQRKTIAVAESCTGGMLGSALTAIPGSSQFFEGGAITYSYRAKSEQLGVLQSTIEVFGAVSEETVVEMAEGVLRIYSTDYGISISGVAGPDGGMPEKPVGTVWIALARKNHPTISQRFVFGADRQANRERSTAAAMVMLLNDLQNNQR